MLALLVAALDLPRLDFTERWSVPLASGSYSSGTDSFAVVGDRVFYFVNDFRKPQIFGCLSAATGRSIWRKVGPVSTASYLAATRRHLVASTENDVMHLDPNTGRTLWKARRASFTAGPVIVGDRMFYEPKASTLVAVDLKSHREVWRKSYPFGLSGGFNAARAVGDGLVFAPAGGAVAYVAQKDGALRWRQSTGEARIMRFEPLGDGVLAVGDEFFWFRLKDGALRWRQPKFVDAAAVVLPGRREILTFPEGGTVYRLSTATGQKVGDSSLGDEHFQVFNAPTRYKSGYLLASRRTVLRLDDTGKPTASFDPQEDIPEMKAMGDDVIVRTHERLARMRPGTAPFAGDLAKLIAKPKLTTADRRVISRAGRKAVPLLIAAIHGAKEDRSDVLRELLYPLATAADTEAMLSLAEREGYFTGEGEGYPSYVEEWLKTKGEPSVVANALLPRFKAAKDDRERSRFLEYVLRGTDGPVVDELLARLQDKKSPEWLRGAIYGAIAASGRADVLETIRSLRADGRRLATPIPGQSATKDSDGDGLPDNVDANPLVAPRELSEREKAMVAAFDARFRFDGRTKGIGLVDYGEGVKPFELVGWKGGLLPRDKAKAFGLKVPEGVARSYPYPYLRFSSMTRYAEQVRLSPDGQTATVEVGSTYGGLDGVGYRLTLRKFGGEWFSVAMAQTWIS